MHISISQVVPMMISDTMKMLPKYEIPSMNLSIPTSSGLSRFLSKHHPKTQSQPRNNCREKVAAANIAKVNRDPENKNI